jgi:hypothetical protein
MKCPAFQCTGKIHLLPLKHLLTPIVESCSKIDHIMTQRILMGRTLWMHEETYEVKIRTIWFHVCSFENVFSHEPPTLSSHGQWELPAIIPRNTSKQYIQHAF